MFKFFMKTGVILSSQFGYKPGGLCINQLLCTAHDFYKSLDCVCDVKRVFLKIRQLLTIFSTMKTGLNWNKIVYWKSACAFRGLFRWTQEKGSIEQSSLFMFQSTAKVSLVQFLVQCSFSYALMIYGKVPLVGTHLPPPLPPTYLKTAWGLQKLAKKGEREIFFKNGCLGKRRRFSRIGEMPDLLFSWVQSWYNCNSTICWV